MIDASWLSGSCSRRRHNGQKDAKKVKKFYRSGRLMVSAMSLVSAMYKVAPIFLVLQAAAQDAGYSSIPCLGHRAGPGRSGSVAPSSGLGPVAGETWPPPG